MFLEIFVVSMIASFLSAETTICNRGDVCMYSFKSKDWPYMKYGVINIPGNCVCSEPLDCKYYSWWSVSIKIYKCL